MSQLLIQQYLNQLASLKKVSGTTRESVVREAFKDLLKGWARSHDLVFVPEYEIAAPTKERRYVDGALLNINRVSIGSVSIDPHRKSIVTDPIDPLQHRASNRRQVAAQLFR